MNKHVLTYMFFGIIKDKLSDPEFENENDTLPQKKPRKRKKRQIKDRRTNTNPVDQQDKSINENYYNLQGNQDRVEFDCPVPDVQPTENRSFLDSRSDTETESESSGDQTFIPFKYLANQVVNREGNTRKSSRVKKPVNRLGF
ncbi:hypothetical protein BpHYR1_002384 [Brachionus plicatilis]|uniref:Uncharacterized protein n=1 Tax=Brachionus plicatilis TaxID=10195 RepID=A0A3M7PJY6_BRAPC|nr:hypothetical protein BpHYR1_002384 [Brachionus plicatilis]